MWSGRLVVEWIACGVHKVSKANRRDRIDSGGGPIYAEFGNPIVRSAPAVLSGFTHNQPMNSSGHGRSAIGKESVMQTVLGPYTSLMRLIGVLVVLSAVLLQPVRVLAADTGTAARSNLYLAPSVVFVTGDGHIHELVLKTSWQHRDLTAAAAAPNTYSFDTSVMAFRRSDGVSMVVYRGQDNHIHSLYLELLHQGNSWQEIWRWADLTAITGSPDAAADPYGYVRSDGISTVVYTGSDGHIHELRLEGGWIWADLTTIAVAPLAAGRAIAYARADGINAIVYVAAYDGHICELRLDGGWQWADLTALTLGPLPMSALSTYVRSDGISTINYTGHDGHVHDIRLETSWIWADLTQISGAPGTGSRPFGYVRGDGINAILYATSGAEPGRVIELRLDNGWQHYELTSVANAVRGYMPIGYVRADGISTVVYRSEDFHIQEIRLETAWQAADLTVLAGAPAADGPPWAYNRSVVAYTYLPLAIRQ